MIDMEPTKHIPVLLEEVREGLHLQKGMVVVDATLGGGGHAAMMLKAVLPTGKVIALDTDREALTRFEERAQSDAVLSQALTEKSLVLVQGNYSELATVLDQLGVARADALLADLGFSSDQIEAAERGFSFREDGPLDMRLSQETRLTAREIVNAFSEEEIVRILHEYGDEALGRRIARAIVKRRAEKAIETTSDLAEIVSEVYPMRIRMTQKTHPATKTFQALRIATNQEFDHLEKFLEQATERLAPGGRLVVITFHSGEDKRVKQFFKKQERGCICPPGFPICRCGLSPQLKILTKKPLSATEEEQKQNPRARSAKLRIAEKI